MLSEISIRNVVLIEALDLGLSEGLSALTGETGAGKSIILDALGLALGARSDRSLVRAGAERAGCTAVFELSDTHKVREILAEAEMDIAPDEDVVLRRSLSKDGRSKAWINDAPVSVRLLSRVGAHLLEVHGQHDGRGLLDASTHIGLLDVFGGLTALRDKTAQAWNDMRTAQQALAQLAARQAKAEQDHDWFSYAISEMDRLAPQAGEDARLSAERKLLQHSEAALGELQAAREALAGNGEYEAQIGAALAALERISAKIGDTGSEAGQALAQAGTALEKAMLEIEEAGRALGAAAQVFDCEPGALEQVEERLFALRAAARKYDVEVDRLADLRGKFAGELALLEDFEGHLQAAKSRANEAEAIYRKHAEALSKERKNSARELDKQVMAELPPLKMERAQFVTSITAGTDGPDGVDDVRFSVSTNPGTALGPLEKIASGGELARFALAIKVALAGGQGRTLIFDEVDQGIGGAVADAVGKRLAKLAKTAQVLVVTHSPQVAASADHQIMIAKETLADQTLTHVRPLAANEREEEIARMLAGEHITDEARAAARKLMAAS